MRRFRVYLFELSRGPSYFKKPLKGYERERERERRAMYTWHEWPKSLSVILSSSSSKHSHNFSILHSPSSNINTIAQLHRVCMMSSLVSSSTSNICENNIYILHVEPSSRSFLVFFLCLYVNRKTKGIIEDREHTGCASTLINMWRRTERQRQPFTTMYYVESIESVARRIIRVPQSHTRPKSNGRQRSGTVLKEMLGNN